MASNRMKLLFPQFEEYAEKFDKLGSDLRTATENALQNSHDFVTPKIEKDIARHRRTGRTSRAVAGDAKVEWEGLVASVKVGFYIRDGGLPSIFLMYGTPRHGPVGKGHGHPGTAADQELYEDIYGSRTQKQIKQIQEKTISRAIKKVMDN